MVNPLFVPPHESHTGSNTVLSTQNTLRCCNRDFRQETGMYTDSQFPPELDCNKVPGKIAPLRTFDNSYGHWVDTDDKPSLRLQDKITRVFPVASHDSILEFANYISMHLDSTINSNALWDLNGTVLLKMLNVLYSKDQAYDEDFVYVTKVQSTKTYLPISLYPVQAYVDSCNKRGGDSPIYRLPSQSTVVTGPQGGTHNNQSIEMGFEEKEGVRDVAKRTYKKEYIGPICAGYTAHSGDAGKSRKTSSQVRVRVLSKSILDKLREDCLQISKSGNWIVYSMGSTFRTDIEGIWHIVSSLNQSLRKYYDNQFVELNSSNMMVPATYCIYYKEKVLYISIAPGVVLRSIPGHMMLDSYMLHEQDSNPIVEHAPLPSDGMSSIQYKYSASFLMTPYVEHDRPPRTLFASGQSTQGIFWPWSPATARVSPLHASKPLVATEFIESMVNDQDVNPGAIWDIFPGEDMVVCYMNMALNYDDSMVVSSKFSDNGGFSTLSLCTYRVSESESIPEIGEKMCGKKYKWWKVDCTSSCTCKISNQRPKTISTGRIPTGTVYDITRTEDGQTSIKILSFSQILTGDKISTMHGQKGIARITPVEDLPIIVMPDGSSFVADLYIAVGSIVSRQTNGQIYESGSGWRAAKTGKRVVVDDTVPTHTDTCDHIINATTGHTILRQLPSGKVEPIKATVGITRVINQTQMTRERHHLTHKSEGKYSLGTTPGRASGGGVAVSEMDFHAMYSSGLYGCAQELLDRGNVCRIPVCTICKAIFPLHDCGQEGHFVYVNMSFDTAIFDQISACLNGSCNRYEIEHV